MRDKKSDPNERHRILPQKTPKVAHQNQGHHEQGLQHQLLPLALTVLPSGLDHPS
jgi:hypothetical protein